ncbi:MAG: DUF2142 domain-containing protein [Oscillospiraceae bacterium]
MKKQKILFHTAIMLALSAALGLVLFFISFTFLENSTTKTSGYLINDSFDAPTPALKNQVPFEQKFSASGDIYGVKVRFHNLGVPQPGTLLVEVLNQKSGEVLLSKTQNSEVLLNDAYSAINFDAPYKSSGAADYILRITPNLERADGYLCIWKNSATGDIAFGIVSYIVSGFIYSWFAILSALVFFAALGSYLACFVFKFKKETAFIICFCLVSVLFNFVLPPYSSPDEEAHINSAYLLSNDVFDGYTKEDLAWQTVYKRGEDNSEIFEDKYTSVLSYEYIYNNFFKLSHNNEIVPQSDSWIVGDFPMVYAIGAVGLKLGRLLNLGFVPLLYLGRLFNLAFFGLCGYLAIKLAPIGKEIFMVLCMLPIALHIANSFSRDAFVISIAFLLIAFLLKLLYRDAPVGIKEFLFLGVLCVLLAPSKMIYAPICTLVFLLGREKLKNFKIRPLYIVLGLGAVGTVIFLFTNSWLGEYISASVFNTVPLESLLAADPSKTFDVGIMLANPVVSLKLILNTIYSNFSYYIKSVVGGVLGYNSINISDFFVFVFLNLIFISTFRMPEEALTIKRSHRLSFLGIFAVILALVVYVGISWTPISYTTIYGIQGKYLLPALPLLLLGMKNKLFALTQDLYKPLCFVAALTNIFVVLNAFVVIVQR